METALVADTSGSTGAARPELQQVTLLLVDDHAIWRDGVRSMLRRTEFQIVGEASSGEEGVVLARQLKPRLVLLDIRMGGGDGLDTLIKLKQEHPQLAVLMLTTYENPSYVARAILGGAAGYLLKGATRNELVNALRTVASGGSLLSGEDLRAALAHARNHTVDALDLSHPLTDREVDVLRLIAAGMHNNDIAEQLFISEGTVKTHIQHIVEKLCVSDRIQAAVWAARHGLDPPWPRRLEWED